MSGRSLMLTIVASATVAAMLVVCFVLPAEYHIDPTGVGRVTGVINLSRPEPVAVPGVAAADTNGGTERYFDSGYRVDTLSIPLAGESPRGDNEVEYKVRMKAGQVLVYSWRVKGIGDPGQFYFDFHGEGQRDAGAGAPQVIEYRQITALGSSGMLVAPFDGIFGWYLQNQSERAITVKMNLSGFYDLIPPGEYGNEAGITSVAPDQPPVADE